ncbi:MAG: HAD hydrolase family protein, partial [Spirochaetes bacterium]|nr:HAD hydrolase family protein [Spirochaetota bacterium]
AATKAFSELKLNESLMNNVNSLEKGYTIGITSGVYQIWELIKEKNTIISDLIGCSNLDKLKYIITPSVKKHVTSELKRKGKKVIALGDSIIDIPMLEESDEGYIVAHEKVNSCVKKYFENNPETRISQLEYSKFKYESIKIRGAL